MFKPISREEYHKIVPENWIFWKDNCPFCDKEKYEWQIFWQWKHWQLLYSLWSYSWDHRHIMAVPYEHVIFSQDLKKEQLEELAEVQKKVKEFFWNENYFSFTRESLNDDSRSVEHLHMHFLVWKLQWKYLRKMLEKQGFPIKQELKID